MIRAALALAAATVLAPAGQTAVDHCTLSGILVDEVSPPDSPFIPPPTDDVDSISLVQECRIRTVTSTGTTSQMIVLDETVTLVLDGDDLELLRDALGAGDGSFGTQ